MDHIACGPRAIAVTLIALSIIAAATAALVSAPAPARADTLDDALVNHTVKTVSPSGTTINLFDYWITTKDDPDNEGAGRTGDTGINQNHILRFTDGQTDTGVLGSNNINAWTGRAGGIFNGVPYESKAGPDYGLVENQLQDGYPKLWAYDASATHPYTIVHEATSLANTLNVEWGRVYPEAAESLAYLFDSSHVDGKQGYFDVKGLLKYDRGYYVYDSKENFASFNEASNAFDVYDRAGVTGTATAEGQSGMFFPFDSGREVFWVAADGTIESNQTNQYNGALNHYFGLTMRTRFMQPAGGQVMDDSGAKKDMIYHFSGDDDVWVYIDGVLVGDIGGIHNEATLDINFNTGDVIVGANESYEQKTTLKALFEKAQGSTFDENRFSGKTFSDGTIHTLNFFYLERGNSASNLHLTYNLMEVPASNIIKVDQDGGAVADAGFELYRANEDYSQEVGEVIASGTTDDAGNLTLVDKDGKPISFDELYTNDKTTHYLLKEVKVPAGYRSAVGNQGGMKLLYTYVPGSNVGVITDAGGSTAQGYIWQNGSHVIPGVKVSAPSASQIKLYGDGSGSGRTITEDEFKAGKLFAVLVKRETGKPLADEGTWHPVWGDTLSGYTVSKDAGKQAAIDSLKHEAHVFEQGSDGLYSITGTELPGNVLKYYWMLEQLHGEGSSKLDEAEFSLSIYFTSGSLDGATTENTWLVDTDNFTRQFSAHAYVANIQNRLFVQKVDEGGHALAGATFSLYEADQTEVNAKSVRVVKAGEKAYDTVTTQAAMTQPSIKGGAAFPTAKSRPLVEGETYYLKEASAPDGYKVNETLVPVVVDAWGAHPYAGDAGVDDGVAVTESAGTLVRTMIQYGTKNSQDMTLHNVLAAAATGTTVEQGAGKLGIKWETLADDAFATKDASGQDTSAANPDLLRLAFGNVGGDDKSYAYGPSSQGGNKRSSVRFESGWGMVRVRQDAEFGEKVADANGAGYTELGTQDLTALFSGSPVVVVADPAQARLAVKKTVEAPAGQAVDDESDAFTFEVKITPKNNGVAPEQGYLVRVFEADGATQLEQAYLGGATYDEGGTVTQPATGAFSVTLKNGQSFKVYGLASGDAYTVSEPGKHLPADYALKNVVDGDGNEVGVTTAEADGTVVNRVSGTVGALGPDDAIPAVNALTYTNTMQVVPFSFTKVDGSTDAGDGDGNPDATPLAGASFVLLRSLDGQAHEDEVVEKDDKGAWPANWGAVTESPVTSKNDGIISFGNLTAGTYRLIEIAGPSGYQLPAGQWSIVIDPSAKPESGGTSTGAGSDGIKITGIKSADGTMPPAFKSGLDGNKADFTYTLPNYKGFTLPVSGAQGAGLSAALGAVLIAASLTALYLIRRRA